MVCYWAGLGTDGFVGHNPLGELRRGLAVLKGQVGWLVDTWKGKLVPSCVDVDRRVDSNLVP
jgi:hypothetical protein